MQKTYTVIEIYEADFGCEERPEGQETMVGIRLKAEDGEEIHRQEADAELYAKNIGVPLILVIQVMIFICIMENFYR